MNNEYFKTKDNKYIVIGNEKDISIVKSNNDIEKILNLENEIETFEKDLENYNNEINNARISINLKKTFNKMLFYAELVYALIAFVTKMASIDLIITTIILGTVGLEVLVTNILGSVSKNEDKLHKYTLRKEVALANIDALSIKLEKEKKNNNYTKENVISLINDNYKIDEKYDSLENNKVKKLILTKPNEN